MKVFSCAVDHPWLFLLLEVEVPGPQDEHELLQFQLVRSKNYAICS